MKTFRFYYNKNQIYDIEAYNITFALLLFAGHTNCDDNSITKIEQI